jgi:AraC-like DNA-binding protein
MNSLSPKDPVLHELLKGYGPRLAPPRPWEWLPANRGLNAVAVQGPGCFFALPVEPASAVKVCLLREPRTFVTIPPAHQCFWFVANRRSFSFLRICGDRTLEKIDLAEPDTPIFHEVASCLASVLAIESRKGSTSWEKQTAGIAAAMQIFNLAWERCRPLPSDVTTRRSRRKDQSVKALHDWFGANLTRPLKLENAAAHFQASPRQLLRMLKEASGFGFTDHLVLHRLLQARDLLMHTRVSITEVAAGVGFTSREAFIRRFGATFGLPPLQFRKRWESATTPADLATLGQFNGRLPVVWKNALPTVTPHPDASRTQTLIISNATPNIVEVFSISRTGQRTREAVLQRGGMIAIHCDHTASHWAVVKPHIAKQAMFTAPAGHCLALIAPSCFGS